MKRIFAGILLIQILLMKKYYLDNNIILLQFFIGLLALSIRNPNVIGFFKSFKNC